MTDLHTYRGNCHCGAFIYQVQLPEIKGVVRCNCSICYKKGYLFIWLPAENKDTFKVIKGDEGVLTGYRFNDEKITHNFCKTCATSVYAEKDEGMAINVRAIQGLDMWQLAKRDIDYASVGTPYKTPEHKGALPTEIDGGKLYTGGCHCGAVTVAVISPSLDGSNDEKGLDCNCSICVRNGYVWTYPKTEQVVLHAEDASNIGRYNFSKMVVTKTFCKICGVNLTNEKNHDVTDEQRAKWDEQTRGFEVYAAAHHPVNLRVLAGVDVAKMEIYKNYDELRPAYVNP